MGQEEEDEEFYYFVCKVQILLIVLLLTFCLVGHCSRNFRIFVVWLIEVRIRERFRRYMAGRKSD